MSLQSHIEQPVSRLDLQDYIDFSDKLDDLLLKRGIQIPEVSNEDTDEDLDEELYQEAVDS